MYYGSFDKKTRLVLFHGSSYFGSNQTRLTNYVKSSDKYLFWEGHKMLAHLPLFILHYLVFSAKSEGEDGLNFCGLLRIPELYVGV